MATILQQLHQDHRSMARVLNVLEAQRERLQSGWDPDYGLLEDLVHYLLHYADEYHHAKEDLIFARLSRRDAASRPAVAALEREHAEIAARGARLYDSIRQVTQGDTLVERERLVAQADDYLQVLRRHMRTEESTVFPQAERTLEPDDWTEIDRRLATRDDPLFGKVVAERYRQRYRQIVG